MKCKDMTTEKAQEQGFRSLGAFVDAWLDEHGEWDPREVIETD